SAKSSAHDSTSGRRRSSARRSRSVMPPQTPNSIRWSSACARHSVRTGQTRQKWRASRCLPPVTKRSSASDVRQRDALRQFHRVSMTRSPVSRRKVLPISTDEIQRDSVHSQTGELRHPGRAPVLFDVVTSRHRLVRPIALLLGLCLVAGVLTAGIAFPAVAGLGLVSHDAGDTVTTVSTDVVDGPLPLTTTVTDAAGNPIARFFEPNQNRQAVTSDH